MPEVCSRKSSLNVSRKWCQTGKYPI